MLDHYLERLQSRGQAIFYGVTVGGSVVLLLFSGWLWWHFQYLSPQTVFYNAIGNNLATTGVTRRTLSQEAAGQLDQSDQVSLGAQNIVKSTATISQTSPKSLVTTETIGTPGDNYTRYTKIDVSKKTASGATVNFSPVVGQWGKQSAVSSGNGAFANAIYDAVPLAHLTSIQRSQVLKSVRSSQVYKTDFTKVAKHRSKGHLYYDYKVQIAPDKYVSLLKQVDGLTGLNQLKSLDPTQYQGGAAVEVAISIDAQAHQLATITYTANNRQEVFTAWGATSKVDVPAKTIPTADIQAKLNVLLSGQ